MGRREDISTILVIGSGPIIIGQACEFDYSGTQACRVLREEGYRVVLANSNPATIMTDPDLADRTYIEPLRADVLEAIIKRERPEALLATMGGQTALNLAMALSDQGVLDEFSVELIGANADAIRTAEDRERFKLAMEEIGLVTPESGFAYDIDTAMSIGARIGFPLIIRPSFILGGKGTGIAHNFDELGALARVGLSASPISEILVERSIAGWKEFELEVMRDHLDNCVVVCSIENFDPVGIHTGDSVTVAPAQTLSDVEYQEMRDAAFSCIRRVGVETGGSNIQFAVNPKTGERLVIEMNPRVSRSSALASKATGFPIAKIAARLAVGYSLDEITNDITGATPASFEPTIDYVVTKVPRWAFEKLPGAPDRLGTRMQSVGEVMAIGRTFPESLQKALRGVEQGRYGLNCDPAEVAYDGIDDAELLSRAVSPTPQRLFELEALLRRGVAIEVIANATDIDPWFLEEINKITKARVGLGRACAQTSFAIEEMSRDDWRLLKRLGFSDAQIGWLTHRDEDDVRRVRIEAGVLPTFKTVDTCGAEFAAQTPYYYSTYEDEDEIRPANAPRVVILGSGPNRIGQGIEFDYCCVHASMALRAAGYETVMVNCNPETVSTDYDTSDRLYFEPITEEDVLSVVAAEEHAGAGGVVGVIVGLGGQTPLKLAERLPPQLILGTSAASIDIAEDRERWSAMCTSLGIPQPAGSTAHNLDEARAIIEKIGYPALVRPSYVLGGRAMEIVYDDEGLVHAMAALAGFGSPGLKDVGSLGREGGLSAERPVLVDHFLEDAIEVDVDAVRDKDGEVLIGGVMEHVEEAGVHSGDSACVIPPPTLSDEVIGRLEECTKAIAAALNVRGLLNVQYAVQRGDVYVIEANPRASRTVPFVSKATGVPLAKVGARVMVGATLAELRSEGLIPSRSRHDASYVSVKEAVLPFDRFPDVDALLGPEMRSTGEVMGIAETVGLAFAKSQIAAGTSLPTSGTIFFSLADRDKASGLLAARAFSELGFKVAATSGTADYLEAHDVVVATRVAKLSETSTGLASDDAVDAVGLIASGEVGLVVNTPLGRGPRADGAYIRQAASASGVPILTTAAAARAAAAGIADWSRLGLSVRSLQEHHGSLQ
jgi:carbamoyl-phosphate synthase large subunit